MFLRPHQGIISKNELEEFLLYVGRVGEQKKTKVGEIIIATKGDNARSIETWNGLPIRYETEAGLLDCVVDFKDYFNEIKRRVQINHLPDSDLTLSDVYVPSRFLSQNGEECNQSLEEYLRNWLNEPGRRQLALLGDYGQGKSTAALMWTYHLVNEGPKSFSRIPLLMELRGTSPRNLTPLQFLGAWAAQYNINPQALMRLLIAGRLVLLFEGFDEMALVGDAEMRLKHFRTLWQFAYPMTKILITGRPNFFLDEEEMKAALGISKPTGDRPYCEAMRLVLFNSDQIKHALRAYPPPTVHQIHTLVESNHRFRELVSRPSLLHIVAVLWERERLFDKVDELTSAYVMDLFIRHSYRRQGLKEVDTPEFMALTTLEREYCMTGIAAYMAARQLPNQITGAQLNDAIADLISSIPESVSTESSAISGETTQPLRLRLQHTEYGVEHVMTDVRACGLLVDDPAASGTFRFGHKSFMEYLFAHVVAERIQNAKSEGARAILKATNANIEDMLLLPVAIEFLSELLVGIKDGKETDHAAKEFSIAKHLFRTIISENASVGFVLRFGVFYEVLTYCLMRRFSSERRPIALALLRTGPFLFVTTGFMMIMMFLTFGHLTNIASRPVKSFFSSRIIATMLVLLSMIVALITLMSSTIGERRLYLWFRICEKLRIQNKTLHRVIGTSCIPWIREQPLYPYSVDWDATQGNSVGQEGRGVE